MAGSIVSMAAGVTADIANMKIEKDRLETEISALAMRVDSTQEDSLRLACETNEMNDLNKKLHSSLDNYSTQTTHVKCQLQSVRVIQSIAMGRSKHVEETLVGNKEVEGNLLSHCEATAKQQVEEDINSCLSNAKLLRTQREANARIIEQKKDELQALKNDFEEPEKEKMRWLNEVDRLEAEVAARKQTIRTYHEKVRRSGDSISRHDENSKRLGAALSTAKAIFETMRNVKSDDLDEIKRKLESMKSEKEKLATSNEEKAKELQTATENEKKIDEEAKASEASMISERRKMEETVQSLTKDLEDTNKSVAEAECNEKDLSRRLSECRAAKEESNSSVSRARSDLVNLLDEVRVVEDFVGTLTKTLEEMVSTEKCKVGEHLNRAEKSTELFEKLSLDEASGQRSLAQYLEDTKVLTQEISEMVDDAEAKEQKIVEDTNIAENDIAASVARISAIQSTTAEVVAATKKEADAIAACEKELEAALQERNALELAEAEAKKKACQRLRKEAISEAKMTVKAQAETQQLAEKKKELRALKETFEAEDKAFPPTLEMIKTTSRCVLESKAEELTKLKSELAAIETTGTKPGQENGGFDSAVAAEVDMAAVLSEAQAKKKAAKAKATISKQAKATAKLQKQLTKAKAENAAAARKMALLTEK